MAPPFRPRRWLDPYWDRCSCWQRRARFRTSSSASKKQGLPFRTVRTRCWTSVKRRSIAAGRAGRAAGRIDTQNISCTDGVQSGTETDIDCGGGGCKACAAGQRCNLALDCNSAVCTSGTCSQPTCSDKIKNGEETDTDCGGTCPDLRPRSEMQHRSGLRGWQLHRRHLLARLPRWQGQLRWRRLERVRDQPQDRCRSLRRVRCALQRAPCHRALFGGKCQVETCTPPFSDCDGDPANGCETNTSSDPTNCGGCGNDVCRHQRDPGLRGFEVPDHLRGGLCGLRRRPLQRLRETHRQRRQQLRGVRQDLQRRQWHALVQPGEMRSQQLSRPVSATATAIHRTGARSTSRPTSTIARHAAPCAWSPTGRRNARRLPAALLLATPTTPTAPEDTPTAVRRASPPTSTTAAAVGPRARSRTAPLNAKTRSARSRPAPHRGPIAQAPAPGA